MPKKTKLRPLDPAEIREAVERGDKAGADREIRWISFQIDFGWGGGCCQLVKTAKNAKLGGKYDDLEAVKLRKAVEDAAAGKALARRSSYRHDPTFPYIVYGSKAKAPDPLLQILFEKAPEWGEEEYYMNGVRVEKDSIPAKTLRALKPEREKKGEVTNVMSVPLKKIISII